MFSFKNNNILLDDNLIGFNQNRKFIILKNVYKILSMCYTEFMVYFSMQKIFHYA